MFLRRSRVQQFPPVKYDNFKAVSVDKIQERNIFTYLNSTNNVNHLNYYIKQYMLQGINMFNEFWELKNFTAYMIYENYVYLEDDENNYV